MKIPVLAWPVDVHERIEGGFYIEFPDWPVNFTEGDTLEEALEQAQDLLETMVSATVADDKDLPRPSPAKKRPLIYLSPVSAAKVRLCEAMKASGIKQVELAKRLKQTPQQVGRLFDLRHRSQIEQLDAAFRALGKKLVIDVKDAA